MSPPFTFILFHEISPKSLVVWETCRIFAHDNCFTLNLTLMKKDFCAFSVKSIQTLGRFGNYSYFCRCQGVTDGVRVNHQL